MGETLLLKSTLSSANFLSPALLGVALLGLKSSFCHNLPVPAECLRIPWRMTQKMVTVVAFSGLKSSHNAEWIPLPYLHGGGLLMAVGQHQWYHFGVGAPPILVCVSGDWDVRVRGFDPWPNQHKPTTFQSFPLSGSHPPPPPPPRMRATWCQPCWGSSLAAAASCFAGGLKGPPPHFFFSLYLFVVCFRYVSLLFECFCFLGAFP